MNYIGSKLSLLSFINEAVMQNTLGNFCEITDMFAGTGVVGTHFKKQGYKVIANDLQYYSYVLNKNLIENNQNLDFSNLRSEILFNTNRTILFEKDIFELIDDYLNNLDLEEDFIYKNYSLGGTACGLSPRMYFSDHNAKKCDSIRGKIECWKKENLISDSEYFCLLASLIQSVDKCANTASVYGAFLKKLKNSAKKDFVFKTIKPILSSNEHKVFNMDANKLIEEIDGEVLYLDPPYNHRQYSANYHILETLAKWDSPKIKGKTGLREDYNNQRSKYCLKNEAKDSLKHLIGKAKYKYILLSYNNEGIISHSDIESIMKKRGDYICLSKKHNRFKADNKRQSMANHTVEYLHCLKVKNQ